MSQMYYFHFVAVLIFASVFMLSKSLIVKSTTMFFVLIADSLFLALLKDKPVVVIVAISISVIGLMVFSIASMQSFGSRDYSKRINLRVRVLDIAVLVIAFTAQYLFDFVNLGNQQSMNQFVIIGDEFKTVIPLIVSSFVLVVFLLGSKIGRD